MSNSMKLKAKYTQEIISQGMPLDYYEFWDFVKSHKNKELAENSQNKLNRIDFKRTYCPSAYQTTSDFNHNNNGN